MTTRAARKTLAGAACAGMLGGIVIALGGCGSSATVSALDPVAQAADATTRAGGAQLTLKVSVSLPQLGAPLTLTGHGDINLKSREGEIFMTVRGLPGNIAGKLGAGALTMTELLRSNVVYIGSSAFASKLPHGAKWLKLDLSKAASNLGLEPQALTSGQTDPSQYLQYLKASGGHVEKLGTATVRGVPTTRYKGSVDLRRAAELLPARDRAAARAAIAKVIAQLGASSLPVEVWVDARHMVRRFVLSLSVGVQGQKVGAHIEEELFGFGPTPAVNPPGAGEVFELSPGGLRSSGSGQG